MGRIYVTSDLHLGHKNIIEYCNRPFKSVEEMNQVLIDNWNSVVSDEDTVYFLGDFCLGPRENIIKYGKLLKGNKILIMGNHDFSKKELYAEAGFSQIYKKRVIVHFDGFDRTIEFSHKRRPNEETHYLNLYGHVHDKPEDDELHKCVCVELHDYKPVLLEKFFE